MPPTVSLALHDLHSSVIQPYKSCALLITRVSAFALLLFVIISAPYSFVYVHCYLLMSVIQGEELFFLSFFPISFYFSWTGEELQP